MLCVLVLWHQQELVYARHIRAIKEVVTNNSLVMKRSWHFLILKVMLQNDH